MERDLLTSAADAFLFKWMGAENSQRWQHFMTETKQANPQLFITWLLDLAGVAVHQQRLHIATQQEEIQRKFLDLQHHQQQELRQQLEVNAETVPALPPPPPLQQQQQQQDKKENVDNKTNHLQQHNVSVNTEENHFPEGAILLALEQPNWPKSGPGEDLGPTGNSLKHEPPDDNATVDFDCTLPTAAVAAVPPGLPEPSTEMITRQLCYICDVCQERFSNRTKLKRHQLLHSAGSACYYMCPVCRDTFKSKAILSGHMRVHSDKKPFRCNYCDYCSSRKFNVKLHMRRHH